MRARALAYMVGFLGCEGKRFGSWSRLVSWAARVGAGRYSNVLFLQKVSIPNGFCSERWFFRKKTFRNKNYSEK